MEMPPLEILYEDNHCLAIAKPAGVTCAHVRRPPIAAALPAPRRARRIDLARSPPADRTHASTARPARPSRPSDLRRFTLRLRAHLRQRHRPARALVDVPAPGTLRADHA